MKIGEAGIALIKSIEQCRLSAYKPTADDVWTCGWGSTQGVTEDTVWTQEQADAAFLKDIEWVERCVNKAVTAMVSQNEADALMSLCFNIGCKNFSSSTLVKALNQADYEEASRQFLVWVKQNGKTLPGLVKRREAERALFDSS